MNGALRTAARIAHATLALLSAAWALLAYVPFTYQAVVKFGMVSWLPAFLSLQPALWVGAIAAGAIADRDRLRERRAGPLAFYAVHAALGLALLAWPVLTRLGNDRWSWAAAVAFLASALWALLLDAPLAPAPPASPRRGAAAVAAASGCALLFTAVAVLRARGGAEPVAAAFVGRALAWSLSAHLLLAGGVALALEAVAAIARLGRRAWLGPLLTLAVAWVGAALLLQVVVFRAIAFGGPEAALVAALAAAVVVLGAGRPAAALLDAAARRGPLGLLPVAAAGAALAVVLLSGAARFDWNFLFQKLTVAAAWSLAMGLALAGASARPARRGDAALLFLVPLVAVAAFEGTTAVGSTAAPPAAGAARPRATLDRLVAMDPAARLLRELLVPAAAEGTSIHGWLQANANLPPGLPTAPVVVAPVDPLEPGRADRPDIFVFVVDSLRRDQLGVYDPSIRHTPNIDRFAQDAVVLRNAFTRYGATGLSEPSIWVGGMTLHQQYPAPFTRLNALQRLLERDGYELLVSMDSVLEAVVTPGPSVHALDPGVATQDLRLGESLERLAAALERRPADAPPLFVYTQAQDLHVSVIHREGAEPVLPGDYGGAYAPYASRVRRLDAALGAFLERLRASGRLERSIVILTADHGDSLGEEGRFGHAYTLFPEIVRVPLVIHLPPALRRQLRWDADAPAFLTDLTPTLHVLLGHGPVRRHPVMGRPLFSREGDPPPPAAPDHYLLASSYGAVFGLLSGDGRRLYVADAINFEDHLFALEGGAGGTRLRLSPDEKQRHDRILVEKLRELNAFYRFDPGPPPGGLE